MSRTALVIWLGLLLAVGAVAVATTLLRPSGAPRASAPLLAFDPAHVARLTVDDPRLPFVQEVAREQRRGWTLTLSPRDADDAASRWPLVDSRVRTALRALAEAPRRRALSEEASLGPAPVAVRIDLQSGGTLGLEMASTPLGGQRLVRTDDGALGLLDEAVAALFTSPGPRAWRSRAVLPHVGAETSELTVARDSRALRLKRVGGDWRIIQPIRADADDALVRQLLDALAAVRVEAFEDDPSPEDLQVAAMDEPVLTVEAVHEERTVGPDGAVRIEPRTSALRLGGRADLEGRTRFARTAQPLPLLIVAVSQELERLEPDPLALAGRTATNVRPENVGMLTLRSGEDERGFRRDADGWTALLEDGSRSPIDAAQVEELLSFLSSRLASEALVADEADWARPHVRVTLYDFADGPLTTLAVRRMEDGSLAVRSDDLELRYEASSSLLALLAASP